MNSTSTKTIVPSKFKSVLFLVAMDVEQNAILGNYKYRPSKAGSKIGIDLFEIDSNDKTILLHKTGVGGVNAAVGLSFIIDRYPVDAVIALGVAGSLSPTLDVGDLVISKSVIQHDSLLSGENGNLLMAPGQLFLSLDATDRRDPSLRADAELAALLKTFTPNAFEGIVLSGNEFVGNTNRKKSLAERFPGALAVDMEAAAIAQICDRYKIPWVVAKTIADRFSPEITIAEDYTNQLERAARRAGRIVDLFLTNEQGR